MKNQWSYIELQQEAWMSHWGTLVKEYQSVLSSVASRGEADVCCPTDSLSADWTQSLQSPLKITLDSARNTPNSSQHTKHQQRERESERERERERERGERERESEREREEREREIERERGEVYCPQKKQKTVHNQPKREGKNIWMPHWKK